MEKVINSYETLFVVDVTNDEVCKATVEKFVSLITANAEEVIEVAEWGKRRLAYLINDMSEGYYVVVTYKAATTFNAELSRLFNIDENVMRSLTVKLEHEPVAKAVVEEPVAEETVAVEETVEVAEAVDAE